MGSAPGVRYLTPPDIRSLATAAGVSPTKKWGQNFVVDANTVRRIVTAADIQGGQRVLEVGPGLGSLTLALLDAGAAVTAVEIDPRLAAELPRTISEYAGDRASSFHLVHGDALTVSADDMCAAGAPTAIVANLPYNVAVPVLVRLLSLLPSVRRVLVMVQSEVADRLAATPGTKTYGVPTVKASFFGAVRRAGTIGADVFWPAPNVSSGLVRIDCYPDKDHPWPRSPEMMSAVFPVVDAAFAQRRKTLRKALSSAFSSDAVVAALADVGIDPARRGETLTTAEFVALGSRMSATPDTTTGALPAD